MNKRRLTKTFTWQGIAIATSLAIQYIVYRQIALSIVNTTIATPVIMVLYYLHEKVWNGRNVK